jgi:hypothetical protein
MREIISHSFWRHSLTDRCMPAFASLKDTRCKFENNMILLNCKISIEDAPCHHMLKSKDIIIDRRNITLSFENIKSSS